MSAALVTHPLIEQPHHDGAALHVADTLTRAGDGPTFQVWQLA